MSPILKSVEHAGIKGIARKRDPGSIKAEDFFNDAKIVRNNFAQIINARGSEIALLASASYGLKSAVSNVIPSKGQHAITISEEFPSGYFTLKKWAELHGCELKIVREPETNMSRGKIWNERIIDAINSDTALVLLSSVHWTDGTIFDLQSIGKRCKVVGAVFIVDGTQSVGASPVDVSGAHIDALICANYKWLLGPYSTAVGYFGPYFNDGIPIEDSWMNRTNVADFANLTDYDNDYTANAGRYNVGEFSNFITVPMMNEGLIQIQKWGVENITAYCENLTKPLIHFLKANDFWIEEEDYRSSHLFGFKVPTGIDKNNLIAQLRSNKVYLSLRKDSVRVSPHVYNVKEDIEILIAILESMLK